MEITEVGIVISSIDEQFVKQKSGIDNTHEEIINFFNKLHQMNALSLIIGTEDGICTSVNNLQPENTDDPISVTEDGIVIFVNI